MKHYSKTVGIDFFAITQTLQLMNSLICKLKCVSRSPTDAKMEFSQDTDVLTQTSDYNEILYSDPPIKR